MEATNEGLKPAQTEDFPPVGESDLSSSCCAICGHVRKLVIDHDHRTQEIRGAVCGHCNSALGFLRDDPLTARRAANYLTKPPGAKDTRRRKRRLPKTISRPEANSLLDAPNRRAPTGLRNAAMLTVMYRAGLRVSEVCALEPRDVDLARGMVRVVDGKGGDGTAYFDAESVAPLIEEWKRERKRRGITGTAPLFCTLTGQRVSTSYMRGMVKRMAKRAGLDPAKVSCHVLRHSFATELLDEGFTIREVQEAVRHADLSTTQLYTHVLDTNLRAKVQRRKRA